ncbi:hypothetical protein KKA02_03265 [Patescibacteria group bacterium]|nr:hypothetical protein [Patescibacteria group bacterium]
MPANFKREISLLPKDQDNNSSTAKLIHWITTVGRVVIIFTELIVIAAFVSRFWLDRKNSDLSESIRQQKAILESTALFEVDYSTLQARLKAIKELSDNNIDYASKLLSLSESTPPNILYKNLSLSTKDNKILAVVSVSTTKVELIANFIDNLNLNQDIKSVTIEKISKKPKTRDYLIDILVEFKNETNNNNKTT